MTATIIPTLRYQDAHKAIDFLCEAFGFERHMVVEADDGGIAHAQLVLGAGAGSGMIMVGTARDDAFGELQLPADPDQPVTQSAYIVVDDPEAHCERARDAGATIVLEPEVQDYGGSLYACRDPEGQLWNFGSYDPFAD